LNQILKVIIKYIFTSLTKMTNHKNKLQIELCQKKKKKLVD